MNSEAHSSAGGLEAIRVSRYGGLKRELEGRAICGSSANIVGSESECSSREQGSLGGTRTLSVSGKET